MTNFKLLQKLLFFMVLGLSFCTLQACSGDDTMDDPTNDYGKISYSDLVATGGYKDLKPLRVTILASINPEKLGTYSDLGIEYTPHEPNFNSSETRMIDSNSGVTNGHFETDLSSYGKGLLEPGTTYYYRAYAYIGGARYNGKTRSFVTPDLQLSAEKFVDLGLSVKWASCNMGADTPTIAGTLLQQCYAYENFNNDRPNKFPLYALDLSLEEASTRHDVPQGINDNNWLGNPNYDVATRTLGSEYRIPTESEWQELEDECYWKSGVCNGVKGFYIIDKVDGTGVIFLPYVKKSNEHDITVYLSAPDDIIENLEEVIEIEEQFVIDANNAKGRTEKERLFDEFSYGRLYLEKEFGVGEVLTEDSHIYCDNGLILRSMNPIFANHFSSSELSWTHPITDKVYNFYEENGVNGSGVLYVRPVSNRK